MLEMAKMAKIPKGQHVMPLSPACRPFRRLRRLLCGALLASCASQGVARTLSDEEARALSLELLLDVEIASVEKYVRKLSGAASSAQIVDAEDIRRHGYRNLAELLQTLPGLYVTNDRNYSYLGNRGVGIVGDWNSRVLFLVDGHRINENVYDGAYIGNDFIVDLELVERVEYVAGPAAAMFYGNNAFFGVVNVVTRTGRQIDGSRLTLGAGSQRAQKQTISYGKLLDNGLDVVLSASRLDIRGQDWYIPEFADTARRGDYEEAGKFFAKLGFGSWTLQLARNERTKGIPNAPYRQVFFDPRNHTDDRQTLASLQYNRRLDADSLLSARIDHGQYDYRGDYLYASPEGRYINRDLAQGRWQAGEFKFVSRGNRHQWLIGGEYRRSPTRWQHNADVGGETYLDDRRSDRAWAIYLHDEIALGGGLTLDLGLRYDRPTHGRERFNPRLGLIHAWRPDTTLKLLYGSAFRTPNVSELYYDIGDNLRPNPALRPETIRSLEAQIEHRPDSRQRWLATLFENRVDALVGNVYQDAGEDGVRGTPDDVYRLENGQRLLTQGLELRHERTLADGRFDTAYTLQRSAYREHGTPENSPRHLFKLNWRQPIHHSGIHAGVGLQYVGPRLTYAGTRVGGAWLARLTLSGRLQPRLDWSLSIHNLFDRRHDDPAGLPNAPLDRIRQDGRTLFFTLGLGF